MGSIQLQEIGGRGRRAGTIRLGALWYTCDASTGDGMPSWMGGIGLMNF